MLVPNKYLIALGLGISWEYVEHITFNKVKIMDGNECKKPFCGRYEDVLLDMIGYIIGSWIA